MNFAFPDDLDPDWNPRYPECAVAANSLSLLMPYVEPYVVRSVLAASEGASPALREQVAAFVRQETQHHVQHRRFNERVTAGRPMLQRVERCAARCYSWLARTRSTQFNLAFAAASETIAFALARWTERHFRELFDSADEVVSTLFLWHLAEEVEHKSVAFDLYRETGGSRIRYLLAGFVSLSLMAILTVASTLTMLAGRRRLWLPVTWWRLTVWSVGVAFEVLTDLVASAMPGHHPTDFSDPILLSAWLRYFDPETATMPLWTGTLSPPSPGAAPAAHADREPVRQTSEPRPGR